MKLPRRRFLHLAAGAAALPTASRMARAQAYPSRPVRLIVGFAPAGSADIIARLIGQRLSERLGQSFIIENRPGAGTTIAAESVVRAPADGYTLLLTSISNAFSPALYEKLNFNFTRDIAPVAGISRESQVIIVHPSVPAKTLPEFIAYARANPNKIDLASGSSGSPAHVAGELFKSMTGIDMQQVPYRSGGEMVTALLGGQVHAIFISLPASIEYIRTGKLHPLAVTTLERSPALPNVPSVAEFVAGYESSIWTGISAPKRTPVEVIDRLNKEINAALAEQDMKARLTDLGDVPMPMSPTEFGEFIANETHRWAKVIRAANIKAE